MSEERARGAPRPGPLAAVDEPPGSASQRVSTVESSAGQPAPRGGAGILLYGMYDLGRVDSAPKVRITMMSAALGRQTHVESITGGRFGRFAAAVRWLADRGPSRVRAVYVEAPTANAMPTDLAFLALMRLLGKPVGVYFRDAYQLFRDVHPRVRRRQVVSDFLWRLTTPLLKRLATVRYAPSTGLASALRLSSPVLLPPGTDPLLPDLGLGRPDVVAAVLQVGPTTGFDTLVEAMKIVRQRRPGARVVVGSRAAGGARAAALPDWVDLVQANRSSLVELLRPARVCVLPLPINAYTDLAVAVRLLDFLAFGKPTVVTDTIEARSMVTPGGIAIVVPDTAEGLAAGILRVLDDDGLARELAAKAGAFAHSPGATWDARARTVLETLGLGA